MYFPSQIPKPLIAATPGWAFRPLIALYSIPADASGWRSVTTSRIAALGNCSPKTARHAFKMLADAGLIAREGNRFRVADAFRSRAYVAVPAALTASALPGGVLRVYAFTLGFLNRGTGRCNPSQATLATALFPGSRCGDRTVRRYLAALRDAGFLEWDSAGCVTPSAGPGRGHSCRYRFPHLGDASTVSTVDLRDVRQPDGAPEEPDRQDEGGVVGVYDKSVPPFKDLRVASAAATPKGDAVDEIVETVLEAGRDARQRLGLPRQYPHEEAEAATVEELLLTWDSTRIAAIYTHVPALAETNRFWASKVSGASLTRLTASEVEEAWTRSRQRPPGTLAADLPQDPGGWDTY